MSPLEKKLQDMGPIRNDGSDKFFGMENVSVAYPWVPNIILSANSMLAH